MKRFLLTIFALGTFANGFAQHTYKIQPSSYLISTSYDLYSNDTYLSTVERYALQLQTVYNLCDERGEYATGTARLLSMGALFNCMKEIDVVDMLGQPIGFIKGNWWTTAAGKFAFYDQYGRPSAVAYVDRANASVSIVDPLNQRSPIALFRRSYVPHGDYYWEVKVVKEEAIDSRVLHIFSAFITDACWPTAPSERSTSFDALETAVIIKGLLDD